MAVALESCIFAISIKQTIWANPTGESPLQYLQALRIQKAKGELENTQKNIESISFEVGYEDVRFFRTLFKRHAGLTPSQYRNKFGVGCH